jgi:serine/threonine-protein kinase
VNGTKLGDYEIVRLIGRGGMGAVYEAVNSAINRRAAIKLLLPEYAEREDVVRRFFNEMRKDSSRRKIAAAAARGKSWEGRAGRPC